jgi:hypothetical protein
MPSSGPPAIRPRIYSADGEHCIAAIGNLLVLNWRGEFPADSAKTAEAAHREMVGRYPPRISGLHIAEVTSKVPPPEIRRAANEVSVRNRHETACIAIVVFGEGFLRSTLQSIALGIFSLTAKVPTGTHRSIPDAVGWIEERMPCVVRGTELVSAIEVVRNTKGPA